LEDARAILDTAIRNNWSIPIYDLDDGHIQREIQFSEDMRVDTPPYDGYLFWISMQAMINYMALQGVTRFGEPREIPG
jgi:hypothetical protein